MIHSASLLAAIKIQRIEENYYGEVVQTHNNFKKYKSHFVNKQVIQKFRKSGKARIKKAFLEKLGLKLERL